MARSRLSLKDCVSCAGYAARLLEPLDRCCKAMSAMAITRLKGPVSLGDGHQRVGPQAHQPTCAATARAPGNVRCPRRETGLGRDSIVNVSQVLTVDKRFLTERAGALSPARLRAVEDGLRLVLGL